MLKASGLSGIAAGDYTLKAFFVNQTNAEKTLHLQVPAPGAVLNPAEDSGKATPASQDGRTAAIAYEKDVSAWFSGQVDKYVCSVTGGEGTAAFDGAKLTYTPAAADAEKSVTLKVSAENTTGTSGTVTVTVAVDPVPPDPPYIAEPEVQFEQESADALNVTMTRNGFTPTGVTLGQNALPEGAYAFDGDTLTLSAAWMNAQQAGEYVLTILFTDGMHTELKLRIMIPKPQRKLESTTGEAAPASLDALTAAQSYAEDISAWFDGQVDETDGYVCTVTTGSGTAKIEKKDTKVMLRYTPAAADAGKTATITVVAKNSTGQSAPVTVTVTVGALPFSDPAVESTALSFTQNTSATVSAQMKWNGAEIEKILVGDEILSADHYSASETQLTFKNTWLRTLTAGSHTITLCFKNCRTEALQKSLVLKVSPASSGTSGGSGSSVIDNLISGLAGASSSSPSVTIPEANVTIFYTPDGGKATLTVEDSESAAISGLDTISLTFPAGDVIAAELSEAIWKAPQVGTLVKFPSGSFFMRSTAPVSGNRTVSMSSPAQNMWYISFTGDPAGVTALLPCASGKWKAVLRTANGERNLPCVYDTNNSCLRVVLPESGTLAISLETAGNPFTDVAAGAWYYDAVQSAYSAKLLQGVSGTLYAPDTAVSRAMLVTILWRLSGSPANAETPFKDVASGAWYAAAAAWAQKQGLVNGYPDGSFRPDAPVSRQELMTILWRFAAKQGAAKVTGITAIADYADVQTVAEYAVSAVSGMVEHGIVNGVGTKPARLAPAEGATRAQLAVILQRFVEYLSGK